MQSTRDLEDSETLSHVDDEINNDLQHFLLCYLWNVSTQLPKNSRDNLKDEWLLLILQYRSVARI